LKFRAIEKKPERVVKKRSVNLKASPPREGAKEMEKEY